MLRRENLHHYQNSALNMVLKKKKCALFLDMGLGKTVTTLTSISDLFYDFSIDNILIIAPLKVANNVWCKESEKWEHLQELDIAIATGSANERLSAINSNKTITLINKENVAWLIKSAKLKHNKENLPVEINIDKLWSKIANSDTAKIKDILYKVLDRKYKIGNKVKNVTHIQLKNNNKITKKDNTIYIDNKKLSKENLYILKDKKNWIIDWKWDMVVIDESSSFKSHQAEKFRALKKVMKHIRSIVLLSGTPSPNGMMDLWSQMYLIDQGERLGRTITNYRQKFFTQDPYNEYSYKLKPGAKEQIMELIKDVCITMTAEDYLRLPKCINVNEFIELPNKVKQQYKELEKEFLLSLENNIEIESLSKATLGNKLLQMCNGSIYDSDRNVHNIHNEKIDRLKEIIEDNPNENFLVAYNYNHDLEKLQKSFPNAVKLETSEQEDLWNEGKIKILLAHPASAGHGLNLQYGGNIIIWYGLTWNLEYYQQFNKRLHRQGQKNTVRNIHLIAKGCIDEKILFFALSNKAKTQNELIEYLKYKLS